jgi:hypothetical protein
MGRDTWRHQMEDKEREKKKEINPIWRGIGCLLIIAFSVGGYFFADWILKLNEVNNWFPVPRGMVQFSFLPVLTFSFFIKLAVAVVFLIVSFGLQNVLYAILFPIQPGKYDSPPLKPRPHRKR